MTDALTVWTGWDVRGGAAGKPRALAAFARAAADDDESRSHYELLAVAGRGFRPPELLTSIDLDDEAAGEGSPEDVPASAELRSTWSVLYRRLVETSPAGVVPYAIYLLGVNAPADATDDELEVFNDFYTTVHLPEVAERRRARRALRYERVSELRAPYGGAPQFLAVYEVDEQAASVRRHVGPPYAKGPEVWQRHTTPWRLWYRRLPGGE